MNRVLYCLVPAVAMSLSGAALRGQQTTRPSEPGVVARNFTPVAYLKASNPGLDDQLGFGSALSGRTLALSRDGNTLAVAAMGEDSAATGIDGDQKDDSASDSGAVYVFTRTGSGRPWTHRAYIKASNTDAYDSFGFSVALNADGNTLAVSTTREDSSARGVDGNGADNSAEDSGAVYVFARNGGRWAQQAYVKASNTEAGDQFGWSLTLSDDGNTMAVGASTEASNATGINGNQADNSAANAGAAYVFTRRGVTWSQQAYLKGAKTQGGDLFGFCVDLSSDGNTLGICGYDEDGGSSGVNGDEADNSKAGSGCAYVFVRNGTTWSQTTYIKQSNNAKPQDAFGSSLAISGDGNTLIVTAADEDGLVGGINGEQYTGPQVQDQSNGALYIFVKANGMWTQQAYVKPSNIAENDLFGMRVAVNRDGNVMVASSMLQGGGGRGVGANQKDFSAPGSGAVYVFTRTAGQWSQRAYLKAPNADAYDEFGGALGLSGDGGTLAVAARGEDGGSAGIGGNQADNSMRGSGAVYVY